MCEFFSGTDMAPKTTVIIVKLINGAIVFVEIISQWIPILPQLTRVFTVFRGRKNQEPSVSVRACLSLNSQSQHLLYVCEFISTIAPKAMVMIIKE